MKIIAEITLSLKICKNFPIIIIINYYYFFFLYKCEKRQQKSKLCTWNKKSNKNSKTI